QPEPFCFIALLWPPRPPADFGESDSLAPGAYELRLHGGEEFVPPLIEPRQRAVLDAQPLGPGVARVLHVPRAAAHVGAVEHQQVPAAAVLRSAMQAVDRLVR